MIGHPRKAEAPQIRRGRQVHLAAPRLVHSAPFTAGLFLYRLLTVGWRDRNGLRDGGRAGHQK